MTNGGITGIFPREPSGGGFSHIRSQSEMDAVPTLPQDAEQQEAEAIPQEEYRQPPPPDRENAQRLIRWSDPTKTLNICDEIIENVSDGESLLGRIGQRVVREYEIDLMSRSEWERSMDKALKLAMQVAEGKTSPWQGASNVVFPLVATAAIQFNARAFPAIVQGQDVVKGIVVGDDSGVPAIDPRTQQPVMDMDGNVVVWQVKPGAKRARADRVAQHMSWQFTSEQSEWIEETDRLLIMLPIIGCMFRKTFFDMQAGRNASVLATAKDVVINYWAKSTDTAPRISELIKLYPYEIIEEERAGTFLKDVQYGMAEGALDGDEDAPHALIEQHRRWDLDGDGYPEPIVVTVHKQTAKVVRIVARYDPEGIRLNKDTNQIQRIDQVLYYTKYDFLPNMEGGIYGFGLGRLLNPINEAVDTTLNQMFDAETLRIHGGGFLGKGLGMKSGQTTLRMGEWKVVNALGATIKDSIVPMVHQGASPVLFQLLGFLIEAAKELASNTEVLSGNQSKGNVPATTTLALIEQGLKVFTAVYKRIYLAEQSEFLKQYRLNRLYLNNSTQYQRGDEWKTITREDYTQNTGIEPIADPSMVSDMQMLARAEVLEKYREDPVVNRKAVLERIFKYAKIDDIEELLDTDQPPDPLLVKKLQIEEMGKKADVLQKMSASILNLANADKVIMEMVHGETEMGMKQDQAALDQEQATLNQEQTKAKTRSIDTAALSQWINTQMATLKGQMEMLGADDGSTAAAAKPGPGGGGAARRGPAGANGSGGNGLAMGSLAAASGQQTPQALPA